MVIYVAPHAVAGNVPSSSHPTTLGYPTFEQKSIEKFSVSKYHIALVATN